jgi:hypothetical protein
LFSSFGSYLHLLPKTHPLQVTLSDPLQVTLSEVIMSSDRHLPPTARLKSASVRKLMNYHYQDLTSAVDFATPSPRSSRRTTTQESVVDNWILPNPATHMESPLRQLPHINPTITPIRDITNVSALRLGPLEDDLESDEDSEYDEEPLDKENKKKKKKRKTPIQQSQVLDEDRSNLEDKHIIIPYKEFINLMESNFVCSDCHAPSRDMLWEKQTVGIATSINVICAGCRHQGSIKARVRTKESYSNHHQDEIVTVIRPAHAFCLNTRLVLALQQCGGGELDAAVHAGMLDLGVNPMHSNWQEVEQEIGLCEIQLGEKIVAENLELEVEATKEKGVREKGGEYPVHEGRVGISVQGDTRWDQRKSGRAYNSDSGAHIALR